MIREQILDDELLHCIKRAHGLCKFCSLSKVYTFAQVRSNHFLPSLSSPQPTRETSKVQTVENAENKESYYALRF